MMNLDHDATHTLHTSLPRRQFPYWWPEPWMKDDLQERVQCLLKLVDVLQAQVSPMMLRRAATKTLGISMRASQNEAFFAATEVLVLQILERIQEMKGQVKEAQVAAIRELAISRERGSEQAAERKKAKRKKKFRKEGNV